MNIIEVLDMPYDRCMNIIEVLVYKSHVKNKTETILYYSYLKTQLDSDKYKVYFYHMNT